jgi:uncharacterized protein
LVTRLIGEGFNTEGIIRVCEERQLSDDEPLQIDEDVFLILQHPFRVINHSCDPTCCIRNKNDLYALKDIHINDEITFDYSSTVSMHIDWSMLCFCGAKNCRGQIGNVLTLPKGTLEKYMELDGLPNFIRMQLKNLFSKCIL